MSSPPHQAVASFITRARREAVALLIGIAIVAAGLATWNPSSGAVLTTYLAPASIDASGATDVTEKLQAFFDAVPDSSMIAFPTGARYRIEGTIQLVDRENLVIDGGGAEFYATTDGSGVAPPEGVLERNWPRHRTQFHFYGGQGITVRNIKIRGAHPNGGTNDDAWVPEYESQHGIEFAGTYDVLLEDCTITDVYGDLVAIFKDVGRTGRWAKNVTVRNCHLERNGRQGISIVAGEDVLIENNYIGQTRRATIDLEPGTSNSGALGVTIRNNRIGPGKLLFIAAAGAGPNVSDVTVEGNELQGQKLTIRVTPPENGTARRFNWKVINNRSDQLHGSPKAAMIFLRVDGVEVRGNYQAVATTQAQMAVEFRESCFYTVTDNDFPGASAEFHTDGYTGCDEANNPYTGDTSSSTTTTSTTSTTSTSTTTTTALVGPGADGPTGPQLTVYGYKDRGFNTADLGWSGLTAASIDVYRNATWVASTTNDGRYIDDIGQRGPGTYWYKVCDGGTTSCSSAVLVEF